MDFLVGVDNIGAMTTSVDGGIWGEGGGSSSLVIHSSSCHYFCYSGFGHNIITKTGLDCNGISRNVVVCVAGCKFDDDRNSQLTMLDHIYIVPSSSASSLSNANGSLVLSTPKFPPTYTPLLSLSDGHEESPLGHESRPSLRSS